MAQGQAEKFVRRAPRYVLRPEDNRFLRFAYQWDKNKTYTTEFINISKTGVAFLIDPEDAPNHGELIKIEVPIPGGSQIAWWGRVARIQDYNPKSKWLWSKNSDRSEDQRVMVGVEFMNLPDGHSLAIETGLENKSVEVKKHQAKVQRDAFFNSISENKSRFALYMTNVVLAILASIIIIRPWFSSIPEVDRSTGMQKGIDVLFDHRDAGSHPDDPERFND